MVHVVVNPCQAIVYLLEHYNLDVSGDKELLIPLDTLQASMHACILKDLQKLNLYHPTLMLCSNPWDSKFMQLREISVKLMGICQCELMHFSKSSEESDDANVQHLLLCWRTGTIAERKNKQSTCYCLEVLMRMFAHCTFELRLVRPKTYWIKQW